jgi:peptidyl-prolyl cis-trans isomerase SurA
MKRFLPALLSIFIVLSTIKAQVLLTYGPYKVTAQEFMRAYKRNNTDSAGSKETSLRNYLDLFINARMKVREAYTLRYDTLPNIVTEVENLRAQLIDKYLADPVLLEKLKQEAFQRARIDREIAHIFISLQDANKKPDSVRLSKRKQEVTDRLKQGQDFTQLAIEYSDDPSAAVVQGRLGFITAFTLPYEMETAIYNTTVNGVSSWVRSVNGWHLFKVLRERPAVGTLKVRQILLAIPPNADANQLKRIQRLADSLSEALKKGASFSDLARLYSNDNLSAANGGELTEFGVGQYAADFENRVIALTKDGEISRPFRTAHGWHLVQRISFTPPPADLTMVEAQRFFEQRVRADNRWRNAKDFIYELVQKKVGYRRAPYAESALWQYSDSLLDVKPMGVLGKSIQKTTPLFTIGKDLSKKVYTAADWVQYATNFRYQPDGSGLKPFASLRTEWEQYLLVEYYKANLEVFNAEYREQLTEFRDGNLFFEIMQQEVWNKAQADTLGQQIVFNKQKGKYNWKPSADVALFFCSDVEAAKQLHARIQERPSNWRNESLFFGERVFYDSTRLEWEQIPNLGTQTPRVGLLLDPVVNQSDNNATVALILRVYPQPGPKSFEEARGNVITDLQAEIEKNWDAALRKKYPIKIDEKVFSSLLK